MNDTDDSFEEAVREGLTARTDDLEIPEGLGSGGIRRARRRSFRRAAMVGVPAVVAVVVVLAAVGSGGDRTGHRSQPHHTSTLNVSDVVKRVSARVELLGASDGVLAIVETSNKQRRPTSQAWLYTDPHNGIRYERVRYTNHHGTYDNEYWGRERLLGGNRVENVGFQIDPLQKTWTVDRGVLRFRPSTEPGIENTARQIALALSKRDVRLAGETTIQGRKALRLELTDHLRRETTTLYVDATTYRPIQEVYAYRYPRHDLRLTSRMYLRPTTPANIARAKDRPNLKGYRRR